MQKRTCVSPQLDHFLIAEFFYVYDGQGNIVRSIDILGQKEYNYEYEEDRLLRATECDITVDTNEFVVGKVVVNTIKYYYDTEGKMTKKVVTPASGSAQTIYYENSEDNTVVKFNAGGKTITAHSKTDSFGRKVFDELQLGTGFVSRQFHYHAGVATEEHVDNNMLKSSPTTQLVSQIVLSGGRTISYEYDEEERITKVDDSVDGITTYTYDALGQLITETVNGITTKFEYDNYGNIKAKGVVDETGEIAEATKITYAYGDEHWHDLLTAYDGQSIVYDKQGNPTSYLGHTLTWEKGRQLKSFDNIAYTYNANGIRTSKTVAGIKHTYTLDGTKILREEWNGNTLVPLYDNEDSVCGIVYNNTPYYFQKNLQGDVIGITDEDGTVVAEYVYDAWGKVIDISGCDACIAQINPFRYRGYYYDQCLQLYYLQSRYYDPKTGRFINVDEAILVVVNDTILVYNLFAYCHNDTICSSDHSGYFREAVLRAPLILQMMCGAMITISFKVIVGFIVVAAVLIAVVELVKWLIKYAKKQKDKKLANSLAALAGFSTAATPPPPNNPKFKGTKTDGSKKLYEKGKVRVEVENMGNNLGDVHLQIKGDAKKYYYNVKDMKFYLDRAHTKLASQTIQSYLNDQKIVDAIIKGLTKYLGY